MPVHNLLFVRRVVPRDTSGDMILLADGNLKVAVVQVVNATDVRVRCLNAAKLGEHRLVHFCDREWVAVHPGNPQRLYTRL